MSIREAVRLKKQGVDTVTTELLVEDDNMHNAGRVTFSKNDEHGHVNLRVANNYGIVIELHRIEAEKLISVLMSMQL